MANREEAASALLDAIRATSVGASLLKQPSENNRNYAEAAKALAEAWAIVKPRDTPRARGGVIA